MDAQQVQQLLSRLENVEGRLAEVEQTSKETKDILEYMKAGIRVIGGLGAAVRWCAGIAAAGISLYYTIKKG